MEALIAGLALGLSVITAVVQFSGNRPVLDLEPDERHQDSDDWKFILRIRNGTSSAIQIRRHSFWFSKSKLIAPTAGIEDMVEQMNSGTVNLWMGADRTVELDLNMENGKRLVLFLRWRRLSGLHLTSLLPLLIVMSPAALARLKRAQTQVPQMHIGRPGRP